MARAHIRIPFAPSSPKFAVLSEAIARAANETGMSQWTFAIALGHFLEVCADGLCRGEPVALPAFGLLSPSLVERSGRPAKAYVAFAANRGLAQEMKIRCPLDRAGAGRERILRHRKAHHPSSRSEKQTARTFTAFAAYREQLYCRYVVLPRNQATFTHC